MRPQGVPILKIKFTGKVLSTKSKKTEDDIISKIERFMEVDLIESMKSVTDYYQGNREEAKVEMTWYLFDLLFEIFKVDGIGGLNSAWFTIKHSGSIRSIEDTAMNASQEPFGTVIAQGHTETRRQGGIDLTANKTPLEIKYGSPSTRPDGLAQGEPFRFNPAMSATPSNRGGETSPGLEPGGLQQLQNAPGFVPVIINIQEMTNLSEFLGLPKENRTVLTTSS